MLPATLVLLFLNCAQNGEHPFTLSTPKSVFGIGFTNIVTEAVADPQLLPADTVYVVVTVGVTITVAPLSRPGCQLKSPVIFVAEANNVTDSPSHIDDC